LSTNVTRGRKGLTKVSDDIFPKFWTIFLNICLLFENKRLVFFIGKSKCHVTTRGEGHVSVTKWHRGEGRSKLSQIKCHLLFECLTTQLNFFILGQLIIRVWKYFVRHSQKSIRLIIYNSVIHTQTFLEDAGLHTLNKLF